MIAVTLLIPTVCYVAAAVQLYVVGKYGMAWAFGSYALANLGLLAAAR